MGKLHPLIVHLPIGILLLNALFVFLSKKARFAYLSAVIPLTLLLGSLSAVAACITGWILSQNGEYTESILSNHKWMGIAVAAASLLLYFSKKYENIFAWIALVIGIMFTGHYGGTLTHGEGYLFSSTQKANNLPKEVARKMPDNIEEALVFTDVVLPILNEKCLSCHNNQKQKGKLNMSDTATFLRGGEHGAVAVAGNADSSEMIKRMLLDIDDKHHMSPKGKTQPTNEDIILLKWWINSGMRFDKKVKELTQTGEVKAIFATFNTKTDTNEHSILPIAFVDKADERLIDSFRKKGILLIPIAPNTHYLQANFVSLPSATDADVTSILPFAPQLIWLKLGHTHITDEAMTTISKLTHLTRLSLDNTSITDKGLAQLSTLSELQYLNVVNTKITGSTLQSLSNLNHLEQVFLFNTPVSSVALKNIKQKMPRTIFNTGGYIVPKWTSDTAVFKKK